MNVSQAIHYNLLTEKWIPVLYKDGKSANLSIIETLQNAANIVMINDPIPSFRFGIFRMLVAFVMDVFRITDLAILNDMLSKKTTFDMEIIREYAKKYEPNFDLFDAKVPFYQKRPKSAKLEGDVGELKKKKSATKATNKTVSYLFQFIESGTNALYRSDNGDKDHAVCPAIAARALTCIPGFMTMRGVGYSPSLNGAPPIYLFVTGENLFQTLLLNSCVLGGENDHFNDPEVGMPVWRSPVPIEKRKLDKASSMFGLTYMPRSVKLMPSKGGICTITGNPSDVLIREMEFGPAWKWTGKWKDPNAAYITREKKTSPIRMREDRDIWRDYGPLLFLHEPIADPKNDSEDGQSLDDEDGKKEEIAGTSEETSKKDVDKKSTKKKNASKPLTFERPAVVRQLTQLNFIQKQKGVMEVGFDVIAMRTEKSKIFEWHSESLSIPLNLALNPVLANRVQSAIDIVDDIGFALKTALKELLNPESTSKSRVTEKDTTVRQAMGRYWQSLKMLYESEVIDKLAGVDEKDSEAIKRISNEWIVLVKNRSLQILHETSGISEAIN